MALLLRRRALGALGEVGLFPFRLHLIFVDLLHGSDLWNVVNEHVLDSTFQGDRRGRATGAAASQTHFHHTGALVKGNIKYISSVLTSQAWRFIVEVRRGLNR